MPTKSKVRVDLDQVFRVEQMFYRENTINSRDSHRDAVTLDHGNFDIPDGVESQPIDPRAVLLK